MRFRHGLLAVLAAVAFPASAAAAPDKTSELSADLTKFEWTGTGTGIPVDALHLIGDDPFECDGPGHDCDYILLDIKHPGSVKIDAAADGAMSEDAVLTSVSYPDIDVYFYASDKDGNPVGDTLTKEGADGCATGEVAESCEVADLKPGFYVVEVDFFLADESTYKASVELSTPVPPTPPAAPAAPGAPAPPASEQPPAQPQPHQPPPPAQPYNADGPEPGAKKPSKKATCKKKAKKVRNKAKRRKALKRCAKRRG